MTTPNKVLANLSARGVASSGGTANQKRFVVLADDNGRLDPSWLAGITPAGTALNETYFVDAINGDDANDGGAGAPLQTIQEGLNRTDSNLLFVLSPGNHAGATVSQLNQQSIVLAGDGAANTPSVGPLTFNNGQLINRFYAFGVKVTTVSTTVGGGTLHVTSQGGSQISAAVSSAAGTATIYPGSNVTSVTNLARVYVVDADKVNYTPTVPGDWLSVPAYVRDALDELSSRTKAIENDYLTSSGNLSDVADADTSLGNIGGVKTAVDVGTQGVGIFSAKNGLNLELRKLHGATPLVTVEKHPVDEHIDIAVTVTKEDIGLENVENTKNNFSAISQPGSSNDSAEGYSVGSVWVDTLAAKVYTCIDSTVGAAIWHESGGGGHVIKNGTTTLTQRENLNFSDTDFVLSDDAGNEATLVALATTAFAQTFTQFSLFGGYLIVDHLLGERVVSVTVADADYRLREVDVEYETEDRLVVDLRGINVFGTWFIKIIRAGGTGSGTGESGAGTGIVLSDRVSAEHVVTAQDVLDGFFTLPATPKYPDKVHIYAFGVRQKNALIAGVTDPDFEVVNDNEVHINANGSPTVTLTGDIVENDVLEIVMDV